jgi:transcriptional regulator with XRE-family HTH domain
LLLGATYSFDPRPKGARSHLVAPEDVACQDGDVPCGSAQSLAGAESSTVADEQPAASFDALRVMRALKGMPVARAAAAAGMSPTYLQKLERGEVRTPSPRLLFRLSNVLDFPYRTLMQMADYPIPDSPEDPPARPSDALFAAFADVTGDEAEGLASILREYRAAKADGVDIHVTFLSDVVRHYRHVCLAGRELDFSAVLEARSAEIAASRAALERSSTPAPTAVAASDR